jgi:hypothetical protein
MSDVLVIFSGNNTWFQSNGVKDGDLELNPVGKGKGVKKVVKTRASAKANPDPINSLFSEMSTLCSDPFWRDTFKDASFGKFPRGFRYNNDILISKIKNKTKNCSLQGMSAIQAIGVVQEFMRETSRIMSSQDVEERNQHLRQIIIDNTDMDNAITWSKIKAPQEKSLYIARYVSALTKMASLTPEQSKQLNNVIRHNVSVKYFGSKNIIMNNGDITSIVGLCMKENGEFGVDKSVVKLDRVKAKKAVEEDEEEDEHQIDVNIRKKWSAFLGQMQKKVLSLAHKPIFLQPESTSIPESTSS